MNPPRVEKVNWAGFRSHPEYGGAETVLKSLREAGYEAFFAGGCVRDVLLGKPPRDFDIATSARPEEIQGVFSRTVDVGIRFGTVGVLQEEVLYQVTTFRHEGTYSDGRHPDQVEFGGAEADALRRDFTVNGFFADPVEETVLDYVDGWQDLQQGVLRAIGNPEERFREDALRLLRAARFSLRLGFPLEPGTEGAIQKLASSITRISGERIRDELILMLTEENPARSIRELDRLGLLEPILPEIHAMKKVEQPAQFHPEGDVFVHTMLVLENIKPRTLILVLGALFHDVGKPPTFERAPDRIRFHNHDRVGAHMTEEILRRLAFPGKTIQAVADLVEEHLYIADLPRMRPGKCRRFLQRPDIEDHLALHRADCLASHGKLDIYEFCRRELEQLQAEGMQPKPLITGKDLIEEGYRPGPRFGAILEAVAELQLEKKLSSRAEALSWVQKEFPKKA